MNQSLLKTFAPAARIKFREAMASRAKLLGLSPDQPPVEAQKVGTQVFIGGLALPAEDENQRQDLAKRLRNKGWEAVIDEAAYTWFNRLSALRYMEVHGFIPQGVRVLTPAIGGSQPEILAKAHTLSFDSFPKAQIVELKMDGKKDEELFRRLILAQCESLHQALPLLFPSVHEDLELLLPENLLREGSLLDWFVKGLPDEEWQEIEVLGWLYQYYISELKDEYMSRKVAYKKEEIPAVTQLFTPKWIVQYLVHNSLGRSWMLHNAESKLKLKMPYYIEPAQQEAAVEQELKKLFSGTLDPEDIRLLDPAMGSGHILITAYEVLREIYIERGYQPSQYARLILEKNLYGLDIDLRATEIACFALLMKAREDDPSILTYHGRLDLNLFSFRDCTQLTRGELLRTLDPPHAIRPALSELLFLFEQGTLLGSLLRLPPAIQSQLQDLFEWTKQVSIEDQFIQGKAVEEVVYFLHLARVLGTRYGQIVSNPPYLGSKGMNSQLRMYVENHFGKGKADLFAAFLIRGFEWLEDNGFNSMITMQSWMFLSSFEELRKELLSSFTLTTMCHLGIQAFGHINSKVIQTTAFCFLRRIFAEYKPSFFKLTEGGENEKRDALLRRQNRFDSNSISTFSEIAASPIAYWASTRVRESFKGARLSSIGLTRRGLQSGDSSKFIRYFWEIDARDIRFSETTDSPFERKWAILNSGGTYRKWFGNICEVVNWENNGRSIKAHKSSIVPNENEYFKEVISWNKVTSIQTGFRFQPSGIIPGDASPFFVPREDIKILQVLSLLNSTVSVHFLKILSPTLNFEVGMISEIPIALAGTSAAVAIGESLLAIARNDWNAFETSYSFLGLPWIPMRHISSQSTNNAISFGMVHTSWSVWRSIGKSWTAEMLRLEHENNVLFIGAFNLLDELSPDVSLDQITLTTNPAYRYKPNRLSRTPENCNSSESRIDNGPPILVPSEGERRMREDGARELVSYSLGCLMGRYSLDKQGLIYAESGGIGFDPNQYATFPVVDDGIVPITDYQWFDSDAALKVQDFIKVVWGEEHLPENLKWVAQNLGIKGTELPLETIRRYLSGDFYKDHLQTYKRRPIYWKFSSGKEKAFEALVYLHRYNKGTLSRMRIQYVVPLTGQLRSKLTSTEQAVKDAGSTADKKRLEKEQQTLQKKLTELATFDENLRHYADQAIELDLDDGVRVNYGKFGDLLANVKDVVGKAEE